MIMIGLEAPSSLETAREHPRARTSGSFSIKTYLNRVDIIEPSSGTALSTIEGEEPAFPSKHPGRLSRR